MSVELDSSLVTKDYLKTYCRPTYRVKWLKNKGAILIVILSYLTTSVFYLLRSGISEKTSEDRVSNSDIIYLCTTLLYPIGGWLADTRVGRYRMIRCSMWIMWTGIIVATFGEVVADLSTVYKFYIKKWIFYRYMVFIPS